MTCLIAISSCWNYELSGANSAQRETWLPDVAQFPGLDYKFFVGVGQGAEQQEVTGDHQPFGGMIVNQYADTILLPNVADDQNHLTFKTKASLLWAYAHAYNFVFRCFPDTTVRVDRLMACGFDQNAYHGDFRGTLDWPGYASGGAGYWLSSKAMLQLLSAPITGMGPDYLTRVEDMWVGLSLKDVKRFDDQRFKNTRDDCPSKQNDFITAHLSYTWGADGQLKAGPYDPAYMYAAHEVWKQS